MCRKILFIKMPHTEEMQLDGLTKTTQPIIITTDTKATNISNPTKKNSILFFILQIYV
jgi:hypothetical protein